MTRNHMAALLLLALLGCSPQSTSTTSSAVAPGGGLAESFERGRLAVINDAGIRHTFDVYLAQTFEQQRRGLMFVRNLPQKTGMLFIYEDEDIRSIWMKNTYLSLDIVFARADGTVSSVVSHTEPLSLRSMPSIEPVRFVLELNAGVARRFRIGPGSRLIWPADQSTAAIESVR
ncbi:MAG: DUF192 domain-containing protein [Gammaproteobacteria bacterium]|nr:DUF192 domain-containing protein [Gammaproteobacteria bacterium]